MMIQRKKKAMKERNRENQQELVTFTFRNLLHLLAKTGSQDSRQLQSFSGLQSARLLFSTKASMLSKSSNKRKYLSNIVQLAKKFDTENESKSVKVN